MAHTFNPKTWEADAGWSLWVLSKPGLISKFQACQGYILRAFFKTWVNKRAIYHYCIIYYYYVFIFMLLLLLLSCPHVSTTALVWRSEASLRCCSFSALWDPGEEQAAPTRASSSISTFKLGLSYLNAVILVVFTIYTWKQQHLFTFESAYVICCILLYRQGLM